MEADGAPFTPFLCLCSILRVFKATATQIREKSEQMLESLRIKLGASTTEGSAPTNSATRLLSKNERTDRLDAVFFLSNKNFTKIS